MYFCLYVYHRAWCTVWALGRHPPKPSLSSFCCDRLDLTLFWPVIMYNYKFRAPPKTLTDNNIICCLVDNSLFMHALVTWILVLFYETA
jgi:hypothetical protein